MFIDQEGKKEAEVIEQPAPGAIPPRPKKTAYIAGGLALIIISGLIFYFYYWQPAVDTSNIAKRDQAKKTASTSELTSGLPGEAGNGEGGDGFYGTLNNSLKAEDISFGYFFEKKADDFSPDFKNYSLPLNIKSDTVNYYDLARKIDFNEQADELNKYGFAVLDSRGNPEFNDFFEMYRFLSRRDAPIVITSDFLIYYFQNNFKTVYKEMEKNIFYDLVRDINDQFLAMAAAKYKKRLSEVGPVNDLALEARRLEAAFFAVTLNLLAPTVDQIDLSGKAKTSGKFNQEEASKYYFAIPDYLKDDVEKEVALIRGAKGGARSPVFLYNRDYAYFKVPDNYKSNAKLSNFYLALRWMNSVFPLYYADENCPSCLLDYDDWLRSLAASFFIASDFEENQELKNRWAIIYKFIAFFSGLRQDLTYLHYSEAKRELFGSDFDIERVFFAENERRKQDIEEMRERLSQFNFSRLEGAFARDDQTAKPQIGMRLLQEPYWPNDYIFSNLTGEELKLTNQNQDIKGVMTACKTADKLGGKYRCRGFGLDIVNLISPILSKNDYYSINSGYENYLARVESLRREFGGFDRYTWNNNVYWVNFNQLENLLSFDRAKLPVFMQSEEWQIKKNYNLALGSWVNLHLPEDKYGIFIEERDRSLGYLAECSRYNYVEPNWELINDLIARNQMLIKMLTMLKVAEKTNAVSIELKVLDQELEKLLGIVKKELSGELLDSDDCDFIKNFATGRKVESAFPGNYTFNFKNTKLQVSAEKVKLLAIVGQFGDKKAIIFGPLFNYSEK